MHILYGIQGTGNGHLTRARALVPELRKAGIEMDFIFSGRPSQDFFNMEIFGNDFRCCSGLSLSTEKGRMNTFKTITENRFGDFIRDIKNLDLDKYDVVLSDFEPVSAWAAKLKGKTSIGISHQCAFLHDVPKIEGYYAAKALMTFFAPTQINIGLHWHHFNQAILPPLIEPHHSKPVIADKILVYMGFEDVNAVVDFLMPHKNHQFVIYAKVPESQHIGHISIKPLSAEFHQDLENASGVISNAGFELASECLSLGKKLLVKPLLGQYEQLSNALALEKLNKGTVMLSLDQAILERWLKEPMQTPVNYPNTARYLAQWLASGEWHGIDVLSKKLWP
jgi:uncharacterized protein (TIGR00661 family)